MIRLQMAFLNPALLLRSQLVENFFKTPSYMPE
jgi:hypothetical protein